MQFQINRDGHGQRTVMIEGDVDAKAAWEVVKWLEGLGREDFPLVLDLRCVRFASWFSSEILRNGVRSLNRKTGPIYLNFDSGTTKAHE